MWIVSAAVLAACPRPSSTPQCQFNSDCAQGQICRDNACVTDLPRRAVSRSARLAALPLGYAGRTALGFGKKVGGKPAEA